MKVILLGSSGLIGRYSLKYLSNDLTVDAINILNRKKSENNLLKVEEIVVDFDTIENYTEIIKGDYLICCLGTTMRKAKSKQAFKKVDLEYPLKTAQIAYKNGVKHFIVISSIGANKNSSSFYLRTKGEMEQQISQIGFESITILRPSFLFGDRDEFRLGEKIGIGLMKLIAPLLRGKLAKYKGIEAETIAIAITKLLKKPVSGKHIYESNQIHEMVYR